MFHEHLGRLTERVSAILWHRQSLASYVHDGHEIKNEVFQFLSKTEDIRFAALSNKSIKKTVFGFDLKKRLSELQLIANWLHQFSHPKRRFCNVNQ